MATRLAMTTCMLIWRCSRSAQNMTIYANSEHIFIRIHPSWLADMQPVTPFNLAAGTDPVSSLNTPAIDAGLVVTRRGWFLSSGALRWDVSRCRS